VELLKREIKFYLR